MTRVTPQTPSTGHARAAVLPGPGRRWAATSALVLGLGALPAAAVGERAASALLPGERHPLSALRQGTAIEPLLSWLPTEPQAHRPLLALLLLSGGLGLWIGSLRRQVRRRTRDLEKARDLLASTIEAVPDPLIELSGSGVILAIHGGRQQQLIRPAEEQIGRSIGEILPAAAAATLTAALAEADQRGFTCGQEIALAVPEGQRWFELSIARRAGYPPHSTPRGEQTFLVLCRDCTERRRMERLYAGLSRCNQAILQVRDPHELFQTVCRIAVDTDEIRMAWVARLEPATGLVHPIAWAGEGTDYLNDLQVTVDAGSPLGRGPIGVALREDRPTCVQEFQRDPRTVAWHERARRYGWHSVAALPLHRDGEIWGGLALYTSNDQGFDDKARGLLADLARDIDLALEQFRVAEVQRGLEDELRTSETKYRILTETIHDVIWSLDPESMRYLYISPSIKRLRGYTPEEVMAQPFAASFVGEEGERIREQIAAELQEFQDGIRSSEIVSVDEVEQICKDGSTIRTEIITNLVVNPSSGAIEVHGVTRDITERNFAYEQIQKLAYFDQLTGLANRTLLRDRFRNTLSLSRKNNLSMAVLCLDLDHFKNINDTLGHDIGDKLLVAVAQRLRDELRPEDTLSRYGGDEYTILLPDSDADTTLEHIQRLMRAMEVPFRVGEEELFVTVSIGVALYPGDGTRMETLVRNADTAMHQVKKDRRNSFHFFTPAEQERSARNLRLSNALHRALSNGELHLVYQPQVRIDNRVIIGAEALIRWRHPELGAVPPDEFIPIAEISGLIVPIGEWVLRQALRDARSWQQVSSDAFTMAVNISAVQFRSSELHQRVLRILEEEDFPATSLELELTESATMENPELALQLMSRLQTHGIQLAIDDFGTGYSSLSYLSRIRAQRIKIDRSFIQRMNANPESRAIVQTIISLARTMGMRTIAEGVETEAQLATLRSDGCDEFQGYLFSRPLPVDAFLHRLAQASRHSRLPAGGAAGPGPGACRA